MGIHPHSDPESWNQARDLLAENKKPRIQDLFDLIHRVNPTGHEHSKEDSREAYKIKSDLQSLLIEEYGDELKLEDTRVYGDHTVGIAHRFERLDACHAQVQSLSPRARSWIRWQQDLSRTADKAEAESKARAPKPGPQSLSGSPSKEIEPDSPANLVELGESALAAFDFETAREALQSALTDPDTLHDPDLTLRSTRALVRLLGDHLAAYEDLLSLSDKLSPIARDDSEVRCLLALAAAKARRPKLARQLVSDLDIDRVNEVRIELALQALQEGDDQACQRWLNQVPEASAFAPQARAMAKPLAELRARLAEPLLAKLRATEQQMAASTDAEELSELCHRILDLQPENQLARQILVALRKQREEQQKANELGRITVFLDRGDTENAKLLLRQLSPEDPAVYALSKRCEELTATQNRQEEDRLFQKLQADLPCQGNDEPDQAVSSEWLLDFWQAPDVVRQRILAASQPVWLDWLIELGPVKGQSKAQAVAAALNAIPPALQHWNQKDALATQQLLTPHQNLLSHTPRGREWLTQIRKAAEEQHTQELKRTALAAARDEEAALERLREEQRKQHAELQATWIQDCVQGEACSSLLSEMQVENLCTNITTPLQTNRMRLIHVEAFGNRIHIHAMALSPDNEAHLVLNPPIPFRYLASQVRDDCLWVFAQQAVVQIDLARLEIMNVHDLRKLDFPTDSWLDQSAKRKKRGEATTRISIPLPRPSDFDLAFTTADERHLWLAQGYPHRLAVANMQSARGLGHLQYRCQVWPIWGSPFPLLVCSSDGVQCQGYDAQGHRSWEYRSEGILFSALMHPSRKRLVVLTCAPKDQAAGSGSVLIAKERSFTGELISTLELGPMDFALPLQAITSKGSGCIYVCYNPPGQDLDLVAITAKRHGLDLGWRRSIDGDLRLYQDSQSNQALAIYSDMAETCILSPEQVPARSRFRFRVASRDLPEYEDFETCSFYDNQSVQHRNAFDAVIPLIVATDLPAAITHWLETKPCLEALLGLISWPIPQLSRLAILDRLRVDFDEVLLTRLLTTVPLIQEDRALEALTRLDDLDIKSLAPEQKQHLAHLQSLCLLTLGKTDQAHEALRIAEKARSRSCQLTSLRAVLDALRLAPHKLSRAAQGHNLHAFVCRLRATDEALAQGDLTLAHKIISDQILPHGPPLQALARIAEIELLSSTTLGTAAAPESPTISSPSSSWLLQHRLGRFLSAWASSPEAHAQLGFPILGADTWTPARLHDLAKRAATELQEPLPIPELPTPLHTPVELDRIAAGAAIATVIDPTPGATSHGRHHSQLQALQRHEIRLVALAQNFHARRLIGRMIGLVIDPESPLASPFSSARFLLQTYKPKGPEIALPVTNEAAFALLARWPNLLKAFGDFHKEAQLKHRNRLTLLHITCDGAAWTQSRS